MLRSVRAKLPCRCAAHEILNSFQRLLEAFLEAANHHLVQMRLKPPFHHEAHFAILLEFFKHLLILQTVQAYPESRHHLSEKRKEDTAQHLPLRSLHDVERLIQSWVHITNAPHRVGQNEHRHHVDGRQGLASQLPSIGLLSFDPFGMAAQLTDLRTAVWSGRKARHLIVRVQ